MLPARAGSDSQSQSNLFRPDLFCLSVNIPDLESIQLTLARTCAVIVNVPDLKAYSSVAALLLRRVTSYASSEALLYYNVDLPRLTIAALKHATFGPVLGPVRVNSPL